MGLCDQGHEPVRKARCEEEHHTQDDDNGKKTPHHVDGFFGAFIEQETHVR